MYLAESGKTQQHRGGERSGSRSGTLIRHQIFQCSKRLLNLPSARVPNLPMLEVVLCYHYISAHAFLSTTQVLSRQRHTTAVHRGFLRS